MALPAAAVIWTARRKTSYGCKESKLTLGGFLLSSVHFGLQEILYGPNSQLLAYTEEVVSFFLSIDLAFLTRATVLVGLLLTPWVSLNLYSWDLCCPPASRPLCLRG